MESDNSINFHMTKCIANTVDVNIGMHRYD